MSLSEGLIYAEDFQTLQESIRKELLDRRTGYTFSNFNKDLGATQYGSITASIWNNLINPLNTINTTTTNYSSVMAATDYISSLLNISLAIGSFAGCPPRTADGTGSGCNSGCLGLCQNCTGECIGTCYQTCENTCTGECQDDCSGGCKGDCKTGCKGDCKGDCSGYCGPECGVCGGGCSDFCSTGAGHY